MNLSINAWKRRRPPEKYIHTVFQSIYIYNMYHNLRTDSDNDMQNKSHNNKSQSIKPLTMHFMILIISQLR